LDFAAIYACQNGHENIVKYLIDKNKEKIVSSYHKKNKQNIEKDIIDKMIHRNKSKSEQLKIIIDIYTVFMDNFLNFLMKDCNVEILEIFFNNYLKFFDSHFIIKMLNYYKNQIPVSDSDFFTLFNNEKYKISTKLNENFDEKDSSYYLFNACESGNKAAVKYLLEHGADVNKEDKMVLLHSLLSALVEI